MNSRGVIALVGLRCVGKSSVGRELALLRGCGFIDLDLAVAWAASEGCCAEHAPTVAQLIADHGLAAFREMEARELARVLEHDRAVIVATGGGVVERADNRALLVTRAHCVWLREDLALLEARLALDPHSRPPLLGVDAVAELAELEQRRAAWYREVAATVIDGRGEDPHEIARRVDAAL